MNTGVVSAGPVTRALKGFGARVKIGKVVSTKMNKSITVQVEYRKSHPRYDIQYSTIKKFMAHDEAEMATEGDLVRIEACRKLSKRKHFTLTHILSPNTAVEPQEVVPLPPLPPRTHTPPKKPMTKKGRGTAPDQIKGRLAWQKRWEEREALRAKEKETGVPLDKLNLKAWCRA